MKPEPMPEPEPQPEPGPESKLSQKLHSSNDAYSVASHSDSRDQKATYCSSASVAAAHQGAQRLRCIATAEVHTADKLAEPKPSQAKPKPESGAKPKSKGSAKQPNQPARAVWRGAVWETCQPSQHQAKPSQAKPSQAKGEKPSQAAEPAS